MKNGLNRFSVYLKQVELLMGEAKKQSNPAMWLFENSARTPFFMLESLAKLYGGMHNRKKFGKMKEHFKLVEDGLGQIDYYNSLCIAFSRIKEIPESYRLYVQEQKNFAADSLNRMLEAKGWLNGRIYKLTSKLAKADWLKASEEVDAISDFYKSSINEIYGFAASTNYHFESIEDDVHELRRKLRWLSIYPQALQGTIQYAPQGQQPAHLSKYLTKEIVESPFNRLPGVGNNTYVLMLNKNYFLALSWMIDKLGQLKDEGLLLVGLCKAAEQCSLSKPKNALQEAYALLGSKQRRIEEILIDAEAITKVFFKENNLQHLLTITVKMQSA